MFIIERSSLVNTQVICQEAIMSQCRKLVMKNGIAGVNMRSVASSCGIALGSLYNYFPSKSALIAATVESVWTDIFYGLKQPEPFNSFIKAVQWVHQSLHSGSLTYPGFFTLHSLSFANQDTQSARQLMQKHFANIKRHLLDALNRDIHVRADAFDVRFTPQGLVNLSFYSVIAAVLKEEGDISTLNGLLQRALY